MMSDYEEYSQELWENENFVISVGDLFDKVSRYNSIMIENEINGSLLFRGQSDCNYSMEPSIFRNSFIFKESSLINDLILHEPFEFGNNMTDFEQLVKMQHYGLPTRLLDITTNPLIALYFACEKCENADGEILLFIETLQRPSEKQVRYFAALAEYDDKSLEMFVDYFEKKDLLINELGYKDKVDTITRIFQTKYIPVVAPKNNERIKRQNGAFLILGIDIEDPNFYTKNTFDLKKDLVKDFGDGIKRSLIIPKEHKKSILRELDIIGMNEAFVYPELEHQTSYIKNKHNIKAGD